MEKVLVVDDEAGMRDTLSAILEREGYVVEVADDGDMAIKKVQENTYDLLVCDIRMKKINGLEVLKVAKKVHPEIMVIMMSAYGTIETAIEAMKKGAYDYISKPFNPDELLIKIKKAEEEVELKNENIKLHKEIEKRYKFANIIGKSSQIQNIFQQIDKVADFKSTVLISGESGTGKELIARAIHYNSVRRKFPFVAVNCGAIPENLLESELFGYIKGAFTGASSDKKGLFKEADLGTLFLDEIGELSLPLQVKLLRVLQDGEIRRVGDTKTKKVDVRIIAATVKDLQSEVKADRFREDLFYRLNVVSILIPPLRERKEDILLLVDFFIEKCNKETGKNIKGISPSALNLLIDYSWHGNVRELENIIERMIIMAEEDIIMERNLPDEIKASSKGVKLILPHSSISIRQTMKNVTKITEQELIERALKRVGGNRTKAARLLEISHRALLYKIKEYGIKDSKGARIRMKCEM